MPAKDFSDREAIYLWARKGKQTIETQRSRQFEDRKRDWITEATVYKNSRDTRDWNRFSPSAIRIDAVLPTLWVQTSATHKGKAIKVHLLEPPALCLYIRTASANCWSWFEGWLGLLWTLCSNTVFISLGIWRTCFSNCLGYVIHWLSVNSHFWEWPLLKRGQNQVLFLERACIQRLVNVGVILVINKYLTRVKTIHINYPSSCGWGIQTLCN